MPLPHPRPVVKKPHRHAWLWEPLEAEAGFVLRTMFGAKAVYLDGKLTLCFCAGDDPWRGLLVCTDRQRQPALVAEFALLTPHPILPKWLYLPESHNHFETVAVRLVRLVRQRDPRIGVSPAPRAKAGRKARAQRNTGTRRRSP